MAGSVGEYRGVYLPIEKRPPDRLWIEGVVGESRGDFRSRAVRPSHKLYHASITLKSNSQMSGAVCLKLKLFWSKRHKQNWSGFGLLPSGMKIKGRAPPMVL